MRTILSGSVIFFSLRVLPSWRVAEAAAAASEISFTSQDSKIQSFQNYFAAGELEEGEKKFQAPKRQKVGFYRTTDPLEWLPSNLSFFSFSTQISLTGFLRDR